MVTKLQTFFAY